MKKGIDAVKTVRLIRDQMYREIKKLSRAELLRYYRQKAARLHTELKHRTKTAA